MDTFQKDTETHVHDMFCKSWEGLNIKCRKYPLLFINYNFDISIHWQFFIIRVMNRSNRSR